MTMSNVSDKYLALLGILKHKEIHGYELNQLLSMPGNAIRIGKANAYKLLANMEEKGFVSSVEQRQGNRPPRSIYSITPAGSREFDSLLKKRLGRTDPPEYPDGVALNFIALLPPEEALPLLLQRREHLAIHRQSLEGFSDEIRASHPGIDFLIRQAELDIELNETLISRYQKLAKDKQYEPPTTPRK